MSRRTSSSVFTFGPCCACGVSSVVGRRLERLSQAIVQSIAAPSNKREHAVSTDDDDSDPCAT